VARSTNLVAGFRVLTNNISANEPTTGFEDEPPRDGPVFYRVFTHE
jgi:hypothetical protein